MSEEYPQKERRKFPRLKINITLVYQVNKPSRVRVSVGEKEIEATTLDLSEAGMSILTDYDIPVSTAIAVEFMIYNVDGSNKFRFYKSIKIEGRVKFNIAAEKNARRVGIVFTQIDEEDKLELTSFVKSKIDSGNTEMFPDGAGE